MNPAGGINELKYKTQAKTPKIAHPAVCAGSHLLGIQFEDREGDQEIGRLVESTVWVNRAHPAYQRAVATRSVGYHIALAVGLALAPLAVEPAREHAFLTAFLSCWGEATLPRRSKPRKR